MREGCCWSLVPTSLGDIILVCHGGRKGIGMSEDKTIDPLPDSFETEEQAGAFWDAHSTVDCQEYLELSADTIEISERLRRVKRG